MTNRAFGGLPSRASAAFLANTRHVAHITGSAKPEPWSETHAMIGQTSQLSRRGFCLCCIAAAALTVNRGWLSPREAYAEARGLVSLIKDSAAASPITTYKLRNNISVLEGSGGNVAVLTGPDGKVLVDAGISVSRAADDKGVRQPL